MTMFSPAQYVSMPTGSLLCGVDTSSFSRSPESSSG